MASKTRPTFYCGIHTDEIITNYCCLMGCQTPLCPECIDEHNKRHKMNGVFPEIDTLNRVVAMCEEKSKLVVVELEDMLARLESAHTINVDEIREIAFNDLNGMKDKLIEQITLFFNNLYEDFVSKLTTSTKKLMDFQDLKQRISQVNEELGNIRDNLNSPNIFEAIKCVTNLDEASLLESFDREVDITLGKTVTLPLKFQLNDLQAKSFPNELRKLVNIESQEIKLVTSEKNVMSSTKKDFNMVNTMKSYFTDKFKQ